MERRIREKIEQIQLGKIPDGYQKTDFGFFPSEWRLVELKQLLNFKNGVNTTKDKYNSGIKMISVMDILKEYPITYESIVGSVNIDSKTLKEYDVTYGDILFQRSSETFEDAGKSNVYLDQKVATYSGFVIRGKKKSEYNPFFLNETLKMPFVRKQIIRSAAGAQHINIGQESLERIVVCLATKREQELISRMLMKWDEVIILQKRRIEQLYVKRRALLQMVFNENNNVSKKIRIGDFIRQRFEKNKNNITNIKSVSNLKGFIDQRSQFSKIVASDDISNYKVVRKNDIAYNPSRINVGSIAVYEDDAPGIISPMYVVFSCNNISPKLLLLLLESERGRYEIKSFLSGSVRNTLAFSDLCEIKLPHPSLNDSKILKSFELIDSDIKINEKYFKVLKQQRKTLQQYLINGIVRI